MLKIKKILLMPNKKILSAYIIIFRILLDFIYCNVVSPMYSYTGMTIKQSAFYFIISWIMILVFTLMFFTMINMKKKGALLLSIIFMCSAIPTTTIVAFLAHNLEFAILNILYWFFMIVFYKYKFQKLILDNNITIKRSPFVIYTIFFFFVIILIICGMYADIRISFNLYDIYKTRNAFKSINLPIILRYLFLGSNMIFSVVLVYGLNEKNRILTLLVIICQISSFFMDGRKSTLFILIITILGYYFIHNVTSKMIPVITMGITIIGVLEKICFGTKNLIDLVIRRLFLVTAYLQYAYFDFFNSNVKDYFRQSIIGKMGFTSYYTQPIPNIIGSQYYIKNSYANNGLFADAYSNFGMLGVLVLPILIICTLKILDKACEGLTCRTCIGIIIVYSFTLLSSSFFTVMFTHGFLLGCIVIYLIPRTNF